jgi:hypothetical protein
MHAANLTGQPRPKRRAALSRHRRKCAICAHSQREAIEDAFSRFESPATIAERFNLGDRRQVYRHAQALGLFVRRNRDLSSSLGLLLEKSDRLIPTVTNFLYAAEKYAKIDQNGETIRRPKSTPIYWDACG